MLAKVYKPGALAFPVYVQPKLDGMRMLYDSVTRKAYSRSGLAIKGVESLLAELARQDWGGAILDGELYAHGVSFQQVMKLVHADAPTVRYHVYDVVSPRPFAERAEMLEALFIPNRGSRVTRVHTKRVAAEAQLARAHDEAVAQGYEGIMVRDGSTPYQQGARSAGLLKLKSFDDTEFRVVGFRVSAIGTVVWECETRDGQRFDVKPATSNENATEFLRNAPKYVGRWLTVKHQGWTDGGKPRFPVGKAFRAKQDLDAKLLAPLPRRRASPAVKRASPRRRASPAVKRASPRRRASPIAKRASPRRRASPAVKRPLVKRSPSNKSLPVRKRAAK
jgi:DNA ligase-1